LSTSYADASIAVPKRRNPLTRRISAWLGIAAAPSFAAMAIITGLLGGYRAGMICGLESSFLAGMAPMYLLMSVFHFRPWLKLIGDRLNQMRRRPTV
jgi:hypothetical protein